MRKPALLLQMTAWLLLWVFLQECPGLDALLRPGVSGFASSSERVGRLEKWGRFARISVLRPQVHIGSVHPERDFERWLNERRTGGVDVVAPAIEPLVLTPWEHTWGFTCSAIYSFYIVSASGLWVVCSQAMKWQSFDHSNAGWGTATDSDFWRACLVYKFFFQGSRSGWASSPFGHESWWAWSSYSGIQWKYSESEYLHLPTL